MSRTLTTDMQTVASATLVRPVIFVEADFDSGDLNLWSGFGSLVHDGKTYIGAGNLLSVGAIQENIELRASGLRLSLSGVLSPLLDKALTENYQGRSLIVRLGAMDESNDVISDPVIVFSGFMDTMSIADSGEEAIIQVSVENRLIEFERTRVRRYTDNDQRIEYPSDDGFEYVAEIQEKSIVWGDKDANPISYGNGGYAPTNVPRIQF